MTSAKERHVKSTKRLKHSLKENNLVQVGSTRIVDKKSGKLVPCRYSDVPTDLDGWVWDLKYIPIHFDIVTVQVKDKRKAVSAWFDGKHWIGLRLRAGNEIIGWKRNPYD